MSLTHPSQLSGRDSPILPQDKRPSDLHRRTDNRRFRQHMGQSRRPRCHPLEIVRQKPLSSSNFFFKLTHIPSYGVYIAIDAVLCVLIWFLFPETKGLTIEEI